MHQTCATLAVMSVNPKRDLIVPITAVTAERACVRSKRGYEGQARKISSPSAVSIWRL
jgi:hypothetical protein